MITIREAKEIIKEVCKWAGIEEKELISEKRDRYTTDIRFLVMQLLREKGLSSSKIGKLLNRSHASMVIATNKFFDIRELRELYEKYKTTVSETIS